MRPLVLALAAACIPTLPATDPPAGGGLDLGPSDTADTGRAPANPYATWEGARRIEHRRDGALLCATEWTTTGTPAPPCPDCAFAFAVVATPGLDDCAYGPLTYTVGFAHGPDLGYAADLTFISYGADWYPSTYATLVDHTLAYAATYAGVVPGPGSGDDLTLAGTATLR